MTDAVDSWARKIYAALDEEREKKLAAARLPAGREQDIRLGEAMLAHGRFIEALKEGNREKEAKGKQSI